MLGFVGRLFSSDGRGGRGSKGWREGGLASCDAALSENLLRHQGVGEEKGPRPGRLFAQEQRSTKPRSHTPALRRYGKELKAAYILLQGGAILNHSFKSRFYLRFCVPEGEGAKGSLTGSWGFELRNGRNISKRLNWQ